MPLPSSLKGEPFSFSRVGQGFKQISQWLLVFVIWYSLFMHFFDLNHEITRMQQEEKQ